MHPLMHSHIVGFLKSQLKSRGWSKFVDKKNPSVLQLNNYGMFIWIYKICIYLIFNIL